MHHPGNTVIVDALNEMDGVYSVVKRVNSTSSTILYANINFLNLINSTEKETVGKPDPREDHVKHDKQVMRSGLPQLNLHEKIEVPGAPIQCEKILMRSIDITTQKGLYLDKDTHQPIGTTVNFSLAKPHNEWLTYVKRYRMSQTGVGGFTVGLPPPTPAEAYSRNTFLLPTHDLLALHSLDFDEVWFYHQGRTFLLHIFNLETKIYSNQKLGKYDKLSVIVPKGMSVS